jgi:glutaredoxin
MRPVRSAIDVTLLTKAQCKACDEAKRLLVRVAADYPLTVSAVDLNSERGRDLALAGGVLFPPGVYLDGEVFSYGRLSERKLRRELSRRTVA